MRTTTRHDASATRRDPTTRPLLSIAVVALLAATLTGLAACRGSGGGRFDAGTGTPPSGGFTEGDAGNGNGGNGNGDHGGPGNGGNGNNGGEGPGNGDNGGPGNDPHPVEPAAEDCVSYNPANLTVASAGADGWQLRDGSHIMALLDTEADADDAVKVARNHTRSCFIGRGNDRPDRDRYIVRYWKGVSGLPLGPAPALDCVGYNPNDLSVKSAGDDGWLLADGGHQMLLLDTANDAERARMMASGHSRLCFIGRDNNRPNRHRYIMEFWRQ
jgi:hypothetical protein